MNDHTRQSNDDLDRLLAQTPPGEAERLREVWALTGEDAPDAPADVDQAWSRLEAAIDGPERSDETPTPRPGHAPLRRPNRLPRRPVVERPRSIPLGVFVAVVVLTAVLAVGWWLRPLAYEAPPGERLALTLPDGSEVELNSGARLRYARHFGRERGAELHGEAFFDVTPGARPFVVSTFNARVRVFGTRFNVRAWPQSATPHTTVTLESGRVALAPAGQPQRGVTLLPGDTRRVVSAASPDSVDVSVADATAWLNGDLVFKDEALDVILDEVERRFAVELSVEPASLHQRRLTTALRQPENAESVIRDLAVTLGLRYRETSTGYELYGRGTDSQSL